MKKARMLKEQRNLARRRGRKLKAARARVGISAQELVERLHSHSMGHFSYTVGAVYAWEAGRNLLREELIPLLAEILGCKSGELFLREDALVPRPEIVPTMNEVRRHGCQAFIGSSVSLPGMEIMLEEARDPNWPPE